MHEASLHDNNQFITLTYNNENFPSDHSVSKRELQLFFKKLRHKIGRFRFFACGEYGEKKARPHYHAILFGADFPDRYIYSVRNGQVYYRSPLLESVWGKGYCIIGDVEFESAAYVARYVMKKRKGPPGQKDKHGMTNEEHYRKHIIDPDTGEWTSSYILAPEFALMSRGSGKKDDSDLWRYGIGRAWFNKFQSDTDKDYVTIRGSKVGLPQYYKKLISDHAELHGQLKQLEQRQKKRRKYALEMKKKNPPDRMQTIQKVKEIKLQQCKRILEEL